MITEHHTVRAARERHIAHRQWWDREIVRRAYTEADDERVRYSKIYVDFPCACGRASTVIFTGWFNNKFICRYTCLRCKRAMGRIVKRAAECVANRKLIETIKEGLKNGRKH